MLAAGPRLDHAEIGVTSVDLRGSDNGEVMTPCTHARIRCSPQALDALPVVAEGVAQSLSAVVMTIG